MMIMGTNIVHDIMAMKGAKETPNLISLASI
jgi:hypothetical protein